VGCLEQAVRGDGYSVHHSSSFDLAALAGTGCLGAPPAGAWLAAGQPVPADQVSFSFSRIEIAYHPQRPDGTLDAPVSAGWDIAANRKI